MGELALVGEAGAQGDLRQGQVRPCLQELLGPLDAAQDDVLVRRQPGGRLELPRILEYTQGNQQAADRLLGIARETLRYKLRDLRLFVTRSFDAAEDNPPRPVRLARRAAAT